jgi:poly(3-hydroxybutyrate) depolymerase
MSPQSRVARSIVAPDIPLDRSFATLAAADEPRAGAEPRLTKGNLMIPSILTSDRDASTRQRRSFGACALALAGCLTLSASCAGDSVMEDTPDSARSASSPVTVTFRNGVSGYTGTTDVTISQNTPTTNVGSASTLTADGDDPGGTGKDRAALIRWDVSSIPVGSTIQSATVVLRITNTTSHTYSMHSLLRPWIESSATWQGASTGVNWQTAGAQGVNDRDATALVSFSAAALGTKSIPLDAAGIAKLQGWVNDPATNAGFVIASATSSDGVVFSSSEAATASHRPGLTVSYLPPATPVDTTPPSVAITAPAPSATISGVVTLTATASDDVGVMGVQFKRDGVNVGAEATSAPYTASLDTTTWTDGSHTITAVARDAAGNATTSAAVAVVVANGAPPTSGCGHTPPAASNPRAMTVTLPVWGGPQAPTDTLRSYQILLPTTYDQNRAYPVIFLFHGAGGSEAFSLGLQDAAGARENAIFVSPSGVAPPRYGAGIGWDEPCDGYDMPFVETMLSQIETDYCVNPDRVFATGFSWGGDFANSVGWCLGDKVRAVAPTNGGEMLSGGTLAAGSARKAAFRITYADNDAYTQSMFNSVITQYRAAHGCGATFSSSPRSNPAGTCKTYSGCDEPVIDCMYPGIGHTPPAPSWRDDVWAFFSSFP